MTAWKGNLNRRQKALYKHTIDIWKVTRSVGAKPGSEVYTLLLTGVPCILEYTPNVNVDTDIGRIKEMTLLTTDKIHMEATVPIEDGYLTVNRTLKKDGTPSRTMNEVHRMLGSPTIHESLGRREANKLMIEAMTMEHPPSVIVAYYPGMKA